MVKKMNPIELGKFIANLRNEKNLTQEELAEKLFIDKRKVSRWECGTSIPDFETLIKLTEILDVSLYELSIYQRIKDQAINKKILNKLKSIKDLKKFKLKKKIYLAITILLGIFFVFTTIYTLSNYGTVEIYKFETLDEDFFIEGNYMHTKNNNIINVTNIGSSKSNALKDKMITASEIFNGNKRIINIVKENNDKNNENIYKNNDCLSFTKSISDMIRNDILSFRIHYVDEKKITRIYDFNFKLTKIYDNKLF